jgi:hypothetical protein
MDAQERRSVDDDELDISRIHPAELHSRVRALGMDGMLRAHGCAGAAIRFRRRF